MSAKTDWRTYKIVEVFKSCKSPLSARDIAEKYIDAPTPSDVLTTGMICNVLSAVDILIKTKVYISTGNDYRITYKRSES